MLTAGLVVAACTAGARSDVTAAPASAPAPAADLAVRLVATVVPGPEIRLAFVVSAATPRDVSVFSPVVPRLRAFSAGTELTIAQPALDVPVTATRYPVGPGLEAQVPCPIAVVFGADGSAGDGFVWTIQRTPAPPEIELEAGLEIDGVMRTAPRVVVKVPADP